MDRWLTEYDGVSYSSIPWFAVLPAELMGYCFSMGLRMVTSRGGKSLGTQLKPDANFVTIDPIL